MEGIVKNKWRKKQGNKEKENGDETVVVAKEAAKEATEAMIVLRGRRGNKKGKSRGSSLHRPTRLLQKLVRRIRRRSSLSKAFSQEIIVRLHRGQVMSLAGLSEGRLHHAAEPASAAAAARGGAAAAGDPDDEGSKGCEQTR